MIEQPHSMLYQWFKISFGEGYIKDERAEVLLKLFTSNTHYSPTFWTEADDKGYTPLHWLLKESGVSLGVFLDCVFALDESIVHSVFNTPTNNGRVILHDLWDKYKKSSTDTAIAHLLQILEKTDSRHWTYWDAEDQHPAEGWSLQILNLQSSARYTPGLQDLSQKIIQVFPPLLKKEPSESPWLTISTSSQIQTLLDSGYTLQDTVSINGWEQPAWRMLLLSHKQNIFTENTRNLLSAAELNEYHQIGEEFQEWKSLSPNDRRAKIGYVRQVLSKTGTDPTGKSSLMYLLDNRSDLLALLHRELIYNAQNEAKQRVEQKDAAGYSLLAYAVLGHYIDEVAAVYQTFNAELLLGSEGQGWFAHEKKSAVWFKNVIGGRSSGLAANRSLHQLLRLTKDPVLLFGEKQHQTTLVKEWDLVLPKLISLASGLSHRSSHTTSKMTFMDEYYVRQAILFIENEELIAPAVLPELAAQLKLAGMWAKSMPGVMERWNLQSGVNHIRMDAVKPPEYCTPGMQEFIKKDGVAQIFRSNQNKNILIEQWQTALQRARLMNVIQDDQDLTGKSVQRRKM